MLDDDRSTQHQSDPGAERASMWSHIATCLGAGIVSGEHPPGSRLPPEHQLAERFGVNRHTVRRALSAMASQGLVRMVQGSGTYVEEFAVDLVLGRRTRHSTSLKLAGLPGRLRVLESQVVRASADVSRALEVTARSRVLRVVVMGEAKGRPLHVGERHFPLPRFDGLDALVAATGSITQAFLTLGVSDYLRRESRVTAVLPGAEVAAALMQPASRPVLRVRGVNVDPTGRPIESATTYFSGDRVTLVMNDDA